MKKCNKCDIEKPETLCFFYKDKKGKNGLAQTCKECTKKRSREWTKKNKERKAAADKNYAIANRERIKEYQKNYREKNKDSASAYSAEYRKKNAEKLKKLRKSYNSLDRVKKRRADNDKKRRKYDIKYRITSNVRAAVSEAVSGRKGALRHLPWTIDDLKVHLEKQFTRGMSWDNYGEWHIDHIHPVKSFNYQSYNDREFLSCWALSNLRPLWAKENCSKQAKITHLI